MKDLEQLHQRFASLHRLFPEIPVLVIPWLHLKHPIHPVQESLLNGSPQGSSPGLWERLMGSVRLFGYAAYLSLRLLQMKFLFRRELALLRGQRFQLVAKTWVFHADPLGKIRDRDFYYGDLQNRLKERGVRLLLLAADPMGENWGARPSREGPSGSGGRIPEACLIPLGSPFRLAFRQGRLSSRVARRAETMENPLMKKVALRVSRELLSSELLPAGLCFWVGEEAVKRFRPAAFITLYEGHGWEQALFQGIKSQNPACRTVGYQHSVLLRYHLALLRAQQASEELRPDVVLCLGPRTLHFLRQSHPKSILIPFGSLRQTGRQTGPRSPSPQKKTVLVLPEGFLEEERLLFEAALEAAAQLLDHRFIFRCHPCLPFHQVRPYLKKDPDSLPNVEVSDRSAIEEDFERSSVVLYRGTAAVFQGVLGGLKPIYLEVPGGRDIDPLFELAGWKERVPGGLPLLRCLQRYGGEGPEALGGWEEAAEYVRSYTLGVGESALDRFLETVGVPQEKRGHA